VSELVHLIHDLREKKEELVPGYILSAVQTEMEFHRKCLEELVKCENTIRSMGRVAPIRFAGYDQFPVGGSLDEGAGVPFTPAPTAIAAGPPRSNQPRARGLYPFQGQAQEELSFQPGDILNIVSQSGDWWTAEMNGRQGLIPANYVQLI